MHVFIKEIEEKVDSYLVDRRNILGSSLLVCVDSITITSACCQCVLTAYLLDLVKLRE